MQSQGHGELLLNVLNRRNVYLHLVEEIWRGGGADRLREPGVRLKWIRFYYEIGYHSVLVKRFLLTQIETRR